MKIQSAAACVRGGPDHPELHGMVRFLPRDGGTLVVAEISGLPDTEPGFFALHIHEGEHCSGVGFADTGAHYNPGGRPHPEHAGDLPPLLSVDGRAYLAVLTGRFRVRDVIGRTVVIHAMPDDFKTQPSGGAGEKIGCGEIQALG